MKSAGPPSPSLLCEQGRMSVYSMSAYLKVRNQTHKPLQRKIIQPLSLTNIFSSLPGKQCSNLAFLKSLDSLLDYAGWGEKTSGLQPAALCFPPAEACPVPAGIYITRNGCSCSQAQRSIYWGHTLTSGGQDWGNGEGALEGALGDSGALGAGVQPGRWLCQFANAALTKYHHLGSLNNRHLSSRSSGNQKSEMKVSAGSSPSEGREAECFLFLSPGFRWSAGVLGHFLACRCITSSRSSSSHVIPPVHLTVPIIVCQLYLVRALPQTSS